MRIRASSRGRLTVLVATLVLLGSVAGCGSSAGENRKVSTGGGTESVGRGPGTPKPSPLQQRVTVKVAYSASIDAFLSLLLAKELGEFEKENLDIQLQQVPTTDGAVLLAQNQAQVQIAGMN